MNIGVAERSQVVATEGVRHDDHHVGSSRHMHTSCIRLARRLLLMQEGRRPSAGQILVAMQFTFAGKSSVRPPVQPISGLEVVRFSDQIRQGPRRLGNPAKRYLPNTEKVAGTATPAAK